MPAYNAIIVWYQFRIGLNNHTIDKLQEVIDGLIAFNSDCAGMFEENANLLQKISDAVSELHPESVWESSNKRYAIPAEMEDSLLAVALNCSGVLISGTGVSVTTLSNTIDKIKVSTAFGIDVDRMGRWFKKVSHTTSDTEENFSVSSMLIVKTPIDDNTPKPVPEVVPVEEPDPIPWHERAWNWVCDTKDAVCNWAHENPEAATAVIAIAAIAVTAVIVAGVAAALIEPTPIGEAIIAILFLFILRPC